MRTGATVAWLVKLSICKQNMNIIEFNSSILIYLYSPNCIISMMSLTDLKLYQYHTTNIELQHCYMISMIITPVLKQYFMTLSVMPPPTCS